MRIVGLPQVKFQKIMAISCIAGELKPYQVLSSVLAGQDIGFVNHFPGTVIPRPHVAESSLLRTTLEVALANAVADIFVIGHAACKALTRLTQMPVDAGPPESVLDEWLTAHAPTIQQLMEEEHSQLSTENYVSHVSWKNVPFQMSRLREYTQISEAMTQGVLRVHGLWVDDLQQVAYYISPAISPTLLLSKLF